MNYVNYDFRPGDGRQPDYQGLSEDKLQGIGSDPGTMARQVAALLGRCLPIPDTPELSFLRCFVTLAFEEASAIANRSSPSAEELGYIAHIEREARAYAPAI